MIFLIFSSVLSFSDTLCNICIHLPSLLFFSFFLLFYFCYHLKDINIYGLRTAFPSICCNRSSRFKNNNYSFVVHSAKIIRYSSLRWRDVESHVYSKRELVPSTKFSLFILSFTVNLPPLGMHVLKGINRPFYRYDSHIELIRFKECYRMPKGHEHISFVFSSAFWDIFS